MHPPPSADRVACPGTDTRTPPRGKENKSKLHRRRGQGREPRQNPRGQTRSLPVTVERRSKGAASSKDWKQEGKDPTCIVLKPAPTAFRREASPPEAGEQHELVHKVQRSGPCAFPPATNLRIARVFTSYTQQSATPTLPQPVTIDQKDGINQGSCGFPWCPAWGCTINTGVARRRRDVGCRGPCSPLPLLLLQPRRRVGGPALCESGWGSSSHSRDWGTGPAH